MSARRPWPLEVRAEALRLRGEGKTFREVTDATGVPKQTVNQWEKDPEYSRLRARKESYRGRCTVCGRPTTGGNGKDAPTLCLEHAIAQRAHDLHANRRWTPETLVAKAREWHALYGDAPAAADWNSHQAREVFHDPERADRYTAGDWPPHTTVFREFESWNAMLEAAGFEPRASHGGSGNQLRRRSLRSAA